MAMRRILIRKISARFLSFNAVDSLTRKTKTKQKKLHFYYVGLVHKWPFHSDFCLLHDRSLDKIEVIHTTRLVDTEISFYFFVAFKKEIQLK